nr:transketolase [uncultured Cohaesibacter sp.]
MEDKAPSVLANAIRFLSADAVQKAKSGHPGMPMGMAEMGVALWKGHLKHNPKNPDWDNRDRFVLSNGHGSMLLYSLLHFTGYDLSMDDIRDFRQLHSKTPGHPEHGATPGVETTTGPLGQGIGNAVGMAIAEKVLAAEFNRPGYGIVDHYTYAFMGDGCLMEGISHEVCSLAGTLGLGKLIALYDDNGISIDGEVKGWFTDDTPARFEAYGWNVIRDIDGHDIDAVIAAISEAKKQTSKPTLICCKTIIGKGAPTVGGTAACHGNLLGDEEIAKARAAMGWSYPPFEIPQQVYEEMSAVDAGAKAEGEWNDLFAAYQKAFPAEAAAYKRRMAGELPADFADKMNAFIAETAKAQEAMPVRMASHKAITMIAKELPELLGASADLACSCLSIWDDSVAVTAEGGGNFIYAGIREFGMGAIMNGIALHGGLLPFGGGYVTFSDYQRNAIRMGALMKQRVIYALSHDSIAVGEDGPTHQPIEHLASLRMIPNLDVWRPCDATEAAVAWQCAIEHEETPTMMSLSRQICPAFPRTAAQVDAIKRGGYIISEEKGDLQAVIIATGGEMEIAMKGQALLAEEGISARVVSMPSTFLFDKQDADYKAQIMPAGIPRVSVEAANTDYWRKYVGLDGACIGMETFGESAPPAVLYDYFNITDKAVAEAVKSLI